MIKLVVALPAEARPLIDRYRLRDRHATGPFPVYRNERLCLTVSGIGKLRAGAATAYLQGLSDGEQPAGWLNVGIAGHASGEIGQGAVAHRITDAASGQHWYPPQLHPPGVPTASVLSLDSPASEYREHTLHDMEAAGFYPIACRCATAELVHSYKVISDNREQPATAVTARQCERLIAGRLEEIDALINSLGETAATLASWHELPATLEDFSRHWRFTVSQQHRLRQLLRRWHILVPQQPLWTEELQRKKSAREVLHWIEQRLHALPVRLN